LEHLVQRDAASALADLEAATGEGVDPGLLIEQLLGYLRDCMVAAAGCPGQMALYGSPGCWPRIAQAGKQLGLEVVLAAVQILDQALARLRYTTQGRVLAEVAVVRICQLEELAELPVLIGQLLGTLPAGSGGCSRAAPGGLGKLDEAASRANLGEGLGPAETPAMPPAPVAINPLTPENASQLWSQVLANVGGLAAEQARHFARVDSPAPDRLVVSFRPGYTLAKSVCEQVDRKSRFERALADLTGRWVQVEFVVLEQEQGASGGEPARAPTPQQRMKQIAENTMVRRASELFGAFPVRVESPEDR